MDESSEFPEASVARFSREFSSLNVNRRGGLVSPHKPCMLLAVIDLAEAGNLSENIISYAPPLLERYEKYFEAVKGSGDHPNSYFPFFHLRTEPFWTLFAVAKREAVLDAMSTARKHRDITDNVDHVELDDALFKVLQREQAREALRDVLLSAWFPGRGAAVRKVVTGHVQENRAEFSIRSGGSAQSTSDTIRSAVFRRVVLEAYDYRCAATGLRLVVPGVAVLVEAAHLIPFSESANDRPSNGMALTPTFHRALDRYLIAPGPDFKWHVSSVLDKRIPDYALLVELHNKPILFSGKAQQRPTAEALRWRFERLLAGE